MKDVTPLDVTETTPLPGGEKRALSPEEQIRITRGHDSDGCFWIMPVKAAQSGEKRRSGIKRLSREEISIDEFDIYSYLSVFLIKYFDEQVSAPFRDELCEPGFQWNLEYNVYSYIVVKKILAEIRQTSRLLSTNMDDPLLDQVKGRLREGDLSEDGINRIVDFYDRFCHYMESMMTAAPEYELISFMGP